MLALVQRRHFFSCLISPIITTWDLCLFSDKAGVRPLYFTILISHTILAAAIVPLVLITLFRAWKADFVRHARLARWTWPIWMYVSVTGVIIYIMLYQLFPLTS